MVDNKKRKCFISEEDISTLLQRYTPITLLALLQEVEQCADVKLNWKELVKKSNTGITNAREYQMLWRHLAYRGGLDEKLEDGAEPLDDDSDLEWELKPFPPASDEASAEVAACVKVMIASGPNNFCPLNNSTVEAPLTTNAPNRQSCSDAAESSQLACILPGTNVTVPVTVERITTANDLSSPKVTGVKRRRLPKWSEAEDEELLAAVEKFGVGNWASIVREGFNGDRNAHQLSQRYKYIMKKQGTFDSTERSTAPRLTEAQLAIHLALNSVERPNGPRLTEAQQAARSALKIGERSTGPRYSEAVLAARSALSQALGPKPNFSATSSAALKTLPSTSAFPSAAAKTSNHIQSQLEQGSSTSKLPLAAAKASNQIKSQSQQGTGATKSRSAEQLGTSKPQTTFKLPKSISSTSSLPTGKTVFCGQSQTRPQSQQGSIRKEPSPVEASGSTMKSQIPLKRPQTKPLSSSCSLLGATAVAAGARIGSPKTAAALSEAAKSTNVIRVPPGGMASVRPGLSNEPHSTSPRLRNALYSHSAKPSPMVKSTTPQQCNAVAAGPTADCALKQALMAAKEIKAPDSILGSCASNEQLHQNGKCASTTEHFSSAEGPKAAKLAQVVEIKKDIVLHPKESSLTENKQVDVPGCSSGQNQHSETSVLPDMVRKEAGSSNVLKESKPQVTAAL